MLIESIYASSEIACAAQMQVIAKQSVVLYTVFQW